MRIGRGTALMAAGVVVGASLGAAGTGIAMTASNGSGTTIHACVARSNGALRVVQHGGCRSNERALSFNTQGPRGLRGLRGPRGAAAPSPADVTLFANVDQAGDLGTNAGATAAAEIGDEYPYYTVSFDRPIGSCAASVQPGYAGGALTAQQATAVVEFDEDDPKKFDIYFDAAGNAGRAETAFMITLTCAS
jgi:hypothetical protein